MEKTRLLSVDRMPRIGGFAVPEDLYAVLRDPGLLAGMVRPGKETSWPSLAAAGFRWIVCLSEDSPSYDPRPLSLLYSAELQDLYGGVLPTDPEGEAGKLNRAVDAVVGEVSRGAGVLVHCVGGTGRTGTVLGRALQCLGWSSAEVLTYLEGVHRARGRRWPESPWQAEYLLSQPAAPRARVRCFDPAAESGDPRIG